MDFTKIVSIDGKDIGSFVYSGFHKPIISEKEKERINKVFPSNSFVEHVYERATQILQRPLAMWEIRHLDWRPYNNGKPNYVSKEELETIKQKYKMGKLN